MDAIDSCFTSDTGLNDVLVHSIIHKLGWLHDCLAFKLIEYFFNILKIIIYNSLTML